MEIILKEDVLKVGKALEVVKVKDGFARNFLFPRKLAILATKQNKALLEKNRAKMEDRLAKEQEDSRALLAKIETSSVTISTKVVDGDKLYGSVTESDIAENLKSQGFAIEKRHISLESPIKKLGVISASVKLMTGVEGKVKVWVVQDED
jgi:large subunit ribosomal protein L9